MDAKFQSSFIPKQPIVPGTSPGQGHISLFYLLGLIIFIIALGLSGAAYIGENALEKKVQNLNEALVLAKNSFELATIDDLQKTNDRIDAAKFILDKHLSFSRFFDYLSKSTYKNIYFNSFTYELSDTGRPAISMKGLAAGFNSLVLQSELLRDSKVIYNPAFSDFRLNPSGEVDFTVNASVDTSLVLYRNYLSQ